MRKTIVTFFVALSVLLAQSGIAQAQDVPVTATISAATIGTRTLTVPAGITLATSSGVDTVNGSFSTLVTELAKAGANPWKVTASLTDLALSGGEPTDTISKSQVSLSDRDTVQVDGGGTVTYPGTEPLDFSAERTLINNAQVTTNIYTGTYATSTNLQLRIPNGSKAGVYGATMTLTLIQ